MAETLASGFGAPHPQPLPKRGKGGDGLAALRLGSGVAGGLSAPRAPRGYLGKCERPFGGFSC
jgi:hypothetical protein